ncbi:MAG TPA: FtsW/RodA/SpoVE family cell cycle protein, partial [Oscillospiraceae bacterium]|nr:FtsW/RodA/SpoVE family cell cycle protein [Oscillospiraceae bacterium]
MPENIRTAGGSPMPKKRKVFGQKKNSGAQDEYKTSKGYKEKIVPGNMDLSFLIIVLILLVIGIVMMFSASYAWAIYESNDPLKYIRKQMMLAGVGIIGMLIVSKIDYHILKKTWIAYGLFGIALVFLILVPFIGPPKSGTNIRRWIYIGSFNFQPSEIMKAGIIILFAYIIAANSKKMSKFQYGMLPFLAVLGVVAGLMMLEPHLSGTIIICAIGLIMVYVGGANIKHIIALVITGAGGLAALLVYFAGTNNMSYLTDRVKAWLDPFSSIDTWQTQ